MSLKLSNLLLRCKVLVVGAGTAGAAVSAKLGYRLGENNVIVLESSDVSLKFVKVTKVHVLKGTKIKN